MVYIGNQWRNSMKIIKPTLILLLSICFQYAWACSCMQPGSVEESFKQADAVFTGTVLNVENDLTPSPDDPSISYASSQTITIKLETSYKTAAGIKTSSRIIKIKTAISSASCGYYFEEGKKYIVYAYENTEDCSLWTNICTRTKQYNQEEADELSMLSQ